MTVVDPSGNDDHGRMPVTSVDRPWITRGVSHATLEGRPPTTTITRQEIPRWNHLFLPRNAREREKVSALAEKKEKKKKKNLNLRRGRNTIGSSPNARFLERRPHGSTDGLIKNLQLWKGSQERITMSLLFKHVFSSSICQCNWNPSSLSAEYFIDIHRKILTANIKFTL